MLRFVEQAETHTFQKPHPWYGDLQLGETSKNRKECIYKWIFSLRSRRFVLHTKHPCPGPCAGEMNPQGIWLLTPQGSCSKHKTLGNKDSTLKGLMHRPLYPRTQHKKQQFEGNLDQGWKSSPAGLEVSAEGQKSIGILWEHYTGRHHFYRFPLAGISTGECHFAPPLNLLTGRLTVPHPHSPSLTDMAGEHLRTPTQLARAKDKQRPHRDSAGASCSGHCGICVSGHHQSETMRERACETAKVKW